MDIEESLSRCLIQLLADGRSEHTAGQHRRHATLLATWLSEGEHCMDVERVSHEQLAAFLASSAPERGLMEERRRPRAQTRCARRTGRSSSTAMTEHEVGPLVGLPGVAVSALLAWYSFRPATKEEFREAREAIARACAAGGRQARRSARVLQVTLRHRSTASITVYARTDDGAVRAAA